MGKKNSSKTRVEPVFKKLYERDHTGKTWIARLLDLPIGGYPISMRSEWDLAIQEVGWGDNEKKLDPPVALLSWLIRYPRKPVSGKLSSDPVKAQKRLELIKGSEARQIEALKLLRENPEREDWHIFEGKSQPDVFLQTRDLLVVIEGKRTERKPTTQTKWMKGRHQMLRHIDCAWEVAGKRTVIGFFIVEGNRTDDKVPTQWMEYAKHTTSSEAVKSSFPHRGPEERIGIAECFAGVTTWQRVCREFRIDWATLPG